MFISTFINMFTNLFVKVFLNKCLWIRVIPGLNSIEVMKLMHQDDEGSPCFEDIERFVAEADSTKAAELMALPGSFHGTLGVGALLVLPKCYVMAVKTMDMASCAIKRTLIPNQESQIESLEKILKQTPLSNSDGHDLISVIRKILLPCTDHAFAVRSLTKNSPGSLVGEEQNNVPAGTRVADSDQDRDADWEQMFCTVHLHLVMRIVFCTHMGRIIILSVLLHICIIESTWPCVCKPQAGWAWG